MTDNKKITAEQDSLNNEAINLLDEQQAIMKEYKSKFENEDIKVLFNLFKLNSNSKKVKEARQRLIDIINSEQQMDIQSYFETMLKVFARNQLSIEELEKTDKALNGLYDDLYKYLTLTIELLPLTIADNLLNRVESVAKESYRLSSVKNGNVLEEKRKQFLIMLLSRILIISLCRHFKPTAELFNNKVLTWAKITHKQLEATQENTKLQKQLTEEAKEAGEVLKNELTALLLEYETNNYKAEDNLEDAIKRFIVFDNYDFTNYYELVNKKLASKKQKLIASQLLTQTKLNDNNSLYHQILQNTAINELLAASGKDAVQDDITQNYHIKYSTVEIITKNIENIALSQHGRNLLDISLMKLAEQLPTKPDLKKMTDDERVAVIDKNRAIEIDVSEYMQLCDRKDRKEIRKHLVKALEEIEDKKIKWDDTDYSNPKKPASAHNRMRIIDITKTIENGKVKFKFTMDMAKVLALGYIMQYPKRLLKIDYRKNPYSYVLGRKLAEHNNMNRNFKNANTISVEKLIAHVKDLPTYNDVMATGKQVDQRIIKPFERDMDALVDTYKVLESWEYCNSNNEPLTDEQVDCKSYSAWINLLIHFKLVEQPAEKPAIEEK